MILYELVTGVCPFRGTNLVDLFAAVLAASPAPLSQLRAECPPGLDAVVRRCLSGDREDRYDSASELAEALAPFGGPRGLASVARLRAAHPRKSGEAPEGKMDPALVATLPAAATTISPSLTPVAVTDDRITVRPQSPLGRRLAVVGVTMAALVTGVGLGMGAYFTQRGQGGPHAAAAPVSAQSVEPVQPVANASPEVPTAPAAALAPEVSPLGDAGARSAVSAQ